MPDLLIRHNIREKFDRAQKCEYIHEYRLDAGVCAQQYMKAEQPTFLILNLGGIHGVHFALLA